MTNEQRIALERSYVRRYLADLKAKGWRVDSMSADGEELSYPADLFACDEACVILERTRDQRRGFILFVYGNDPSEVLCDCSTSIWDDTKATSDWIEQRTL